MRRCSRPRRGTPKTWPSGDGFEHDGPPRRHAAVAQRAVGLHLQPHYRLLSRREHRLGRRSGWPRRRAIVGGWIKSTSHRANILDATFRDTGYRRRPRTVPASLARGQAGAIYTQDFGRIIRPLSVPALCLCRSLAPRRPCQALGSDNLAAPNSIDKEKRQLWEYSTASRRSSPARRAASAAPRRSCSPRRARR